MVTEGTGASQWPDTTSSAEGVAGSEPGRLRSQSAMRSQVSRGPMVHSMKKHGPPPWGR